MEELTKEQLVEEIKKLISVDGSKVHINPNYLEYFEIQELQQIKEQLLEIKTTHKNTSKDYLDQIYEICGT